MNAICYTTPTPTPATGNSQSAPAQLRAPVSRWPLSRGWFWLPLVWALPPTLGLAADGSSLAAWAWLVLCGFCSLGIFRTLLLSNEAPASAAANREEDRQSASARDAVLAAGALLLMCWWSLLLPLFCLLLLGPAALLETSALRLCRLSRQPGARTRDLEAERCRLQGMHGDLLRLFGVLLMVGGAVWLTGREELTSGNLATLILLMAIYVWGLSSRLSRILSVTA